MRFLFVCLLWFLLIGIILNVTGIIVTICVYAFMSSPITGMMSVLFFIGVFSVVSALFWW